MSTDLNKKGSIMNVGVCDFLIMYSNIFSFILKCIYTKPL
ncbi:MAG: hypothetical protein K0S41_1788, partial [Anaerocolumna sp.]|nr:hypothetical protein [Anaerocolumna sp.]